MSSQEEAKLSDHSMSLENSSHAVQWFWQSDIDPWKEKDSTKWNWTPYSFENSVRIEDVYSQSQNVVDLGDYEIDLKKLIQIKKSDMNKIRRIKRELNMTLQNRFKLELPQPVSLNKSQQGPASLTLQHYSEFIMKRTQETYKIFQRLSELNLDSKRSEYQDVIQEVLKSILKAAESCEKAVNSGRFLYWKSSVQEAKQIIYEIENKSKNPDLRLKDFLKIVLRVYSMETFVCYWLNELLRNENWAEINAPYLVCLAYTFQVKDYIISYQEPRGLRETFGALFKSKKVVLYHGTVLTKEQLRFYQPDNTKLFSWNGVISASRSKEQALSFALLSLDKAKTEEKQGVLFYIEADLGSESEGMIDVSQDSKFPHEQEVILAPGAVFEVISSQLNKDNNVYKVKLALRKKFRENNDIISEDKARIAGLPFDDIIKALELLEDSLVANLEIENCVLDCHLMELIGNMIRTKNIKQENIMIKNNKVILDSLMSLCYYFPGSKFGCMWTENDVTIKNDIDNVKDAIKNHEIGYIPCRDAVMKAIFDKGLFHNFCNEILSRAQMFVLNINFKKCNLLSDRDLEVLKDAIKSNKKFTHFEIDFGHCKQISDQGFHSILDTIKSITSIEYLTLDFSYSNITDQGLDNLQEALKSLNSLNSLTLYFIDCQKISDHGIVKLRQAINCRPSLKSLNLSFAICKQISGRGLYYIKDALKSMTSLESLRLSFRNCEQIIDKDLYEIADALKTLTSLTFLHLDLFFCKEISDKGMDNLNNAFPSLTMLKRLELEFGCCKISDQGLEKLTNVLKPLTLLNYITLNLNDAYNVSNHAVDKLKSALKNVSVYKYNYPGTGIFNY